MTDLKGFWGDLPGEWQLLRNRFIFRERNERGGEDVPLAAVSQKHGVLDKRELEVLEGRKLSAENDDLSKYKRIRPGDLVYNKMRMWQGAVGASAIEALVSPAYVVAEPQRGASPRFMAYLLKSQPYVVQSGLLSYGICDDQNSLRWEDFANLWTPLPPVQEQERIANFLDEQTARIDALIAEKERLSETLKEYRKLKIGEAVLGGGASSKTCSGPSTEPWLSKVPAHWSLPKVKHLFRTTSGSTPSTDKRELYYDGGEIPWIRSLDLSDGPVDRAEVFVTEAALRDTACKLLPAGTVLIAMYGGDGTIGKSGRLQIEASCNQALCAILPCKEVLPEFLHWYMVFRRPYWMVDSDGTRKDPNISQEVVREARLPLPPLDEQRRIVRELDTATSQVDALMAHVASHIERLREYRSSLISAAVTGQIDVGAFNERPRLAA